MVYLLSFRAAISAEALLSCLLLSFYMYLCFMWYSLTVQIKWILRESEAPDGRMERRTDRRTECNTLLRPSVRTA